MKTVTKIARLGLQVKSLFAPRCRPWYFDPDWYRTAYPDVAAAGMDPLQHYLRYGHLEGRLPAFMLSVARERDLRWGLEDIAQRGLERLARGTLPDQTQADRVWATLALARHAARDNDWSEAAKWLETLDPQDDLIDGFCLLDPSLLAIETWVRTGEPVRARTQLALARKRFGPQPDLALAQANLTAAISGLGPTWLEGMNAIYRRSGLSGIDLAPPQGGAAPFDRLRAAASQKQRSSGPLVSVIMPVRDAQATIATALNSLCDQSWQKLEVLVVDNGSRDGTAAIVRAIAAKDPRVRLLDGSAAPGAYGARNLGMAAAKGSFLTVMDGDDWAHPNRIAHQATALIKAPSKVIGVMSSWVRTTPELIFTRWWKDDGLIHPDISSLMIRAEARARLGAWDVVRGGSDSEYVARIRAVFGAEAILQVLPDLPLSFGRVHDQSLTQTAQTQISSYLFGARRDYEEAAARWHSSKGFADALPLPAQPNARPFPAPVALMIADQLDATEVTTETFDSTWYLHTYSDLRDRAVDPLLHYQMQGEAEGRSPSARFSPSAYALAYGPLNTSALSHFAQTGQAQGHSGLPEFEGQRAHVAGRDHILMFAHQALSEVYGAERSLLDTLDSAAEAGVNVSVVLPHILNAPYLAALQARCTRVYVRPYGWRFGDVAPPQATLTDLADLIIRCGATQVHVNTSVLDTPLRAARLAGVASVLHVHELPASDPRLCLGLGLTAHELHDQLLTQADHFIVNSRPVADWLAAPRDRMRLMPNRIDAGLLYLPDGRLNPKDGPLRVGLVGSLVAKKGLQDIIAVAQAALAQRVAVEVVLIGPMTPDLAEAGPLPANVTHLGYMADPAEAIAQCDIVVSLSQVAESFGRSVLEAMAAGRPVICYDRGAPPDLVGRDGAAGRVVPADKPEAVVQVLSEWLSDPSALPDLSHTARARARAHLEQARAAAVKIFEQGAPNLPPPASSDPSA